MVMSDNWCSLLLYGLTTGVAQMVDSLSAMWETRVQSLGWQDPLEEVVVTPVFLPGESHGQRSLAGYST